jgi:hypothetical protein
VRFRSQPLFFSASRRTLRLWSCMETRAVSDEHRRSMFSESPAHGQASERLIRGREEKSEGLLSMPATGETARFSQAKRL